VIQLSCRRACRRLRKVRSNHSLAVAARYVATKSLIPIGMVVVLGCEKCAEEVVAQALKQGSSFQDIDRALRTVAQVQHLECFNQTFGPDVAGRMEKPLAAARRALQQAMDRPVPRD
jgi:hypothetical protein